MHFHTSLVLSSCLEYSCGYRHITSEQFISPPKILVYNIYIYFLFFSATYICALLIELHGCYRVFHESLEKLRDWSLAVWG